MTSVLGLSRRFSLPTQPTEPWRSLVLIVWAVVALYARVAVLDLYAYVSCVLECIMWDYGFRSERSRL